MNAAGYLLDFFVKPKGDNPEAKYTMADLSLAMSETDACLQSQAADGSEEAELAFACMPSLWVMFMTAYNKGGNAMTLSRPNVALSREQQFALLAAKRLLDLKPTQYDEARRMKITEMLDSIPDLLKDTALPEDLKRYVHLFEEQVRSALTEYDITGDFKLDLAFNRLQGAFNLVISSAKDDKTIGKVKEFINSKLFPCISVVALLMGIQSNGIEAYQFYAPEQIASSSSQPVDATHNEQSPQQ